VSEPDQIEELERIAKRDAAAVVEIHKLFMERLGKPIEPHTPQYARQLDFIHKMLADHAEAVERERRRAMRDDGD
jgi:hypothetical protein